MKSTIVENPPPVESPHNFGSGLTTTAFIQQASHDVRGAFFGVSGVVAILKEAIANDEEPEPIMEHLTIACNNYKYKLDNYIEYIRLDAGMSDVFREQTNLKKLVRKIVADSKHLLQERKLKIEVSFSPSIPEMLLSDERRVSIVIKNLLNNAIYFSPDEGLVKVLVKTDNDESVSIIVEDHGEGMTPEQVDSLFTLLSPERGKLRNPAGLGMLVTKYLVEDILKGRLQVSSSPKNGTSFKVVLSANDKDALSKKAGDL
jgi:signal transduction histidine kinase